MPALPLWTVTLGPIRPGRAVGGHRRFSRQCTHEQRKLLRRLLGEIPDTLRPFGPSLVRKYGGGAGGLVLESWRLPSGDRVLELSTKCRPQVAARRAGKLRALLAELNVSASPNQVTKTDLTLLAPADH